MLWSPNNVLLLLLNKLPVLLFCGLNPNKELLLLLFILLLLLLLIPNNPPVLLLFPNKLELVLILFSNKLLPELLFGVLLNKKLFC